MPFALLTVMVLVWGLPAIKPLGTPATKEWLDARWSWKPQVKVLHLQVAKGTAVTGRDAPGPADLEKAVLDVVPLSATGTAVFAAAVLSGLLLGVSLGAQARILGRTVVRMAPAIFAILSMLALGFVTKYSGMDAVLGLAFTRTGPVLYPIFGTLLGWLGVALTGSDTSSNVLFGNLQKITATKLGLDPILMAAANSTGGVMGKMIDAQSIVVAAAATGEDGREGEILRAVLRHSIAPRLAGRGDRLDLRPCHALDGGRPSVGARPPERKRRRGALQQPPVMGRTGGMNSGRLGSGFESERRRGNGAVGPSGKTWTSWPDRSAPVPTSIGEVRRLGATGSPRVERLGALDGGLRLLVGPILVFIGFPLGRLANDVRGRGGGRLLGRKLLNGSRRLAAGALFGRSCWYSIAVQRPLDTSPRGAGKA